ncbi:hypothetical protein GGF50DRAFT_129602 [Schizophyllum commune]
MSWLPKPLYSQSMMWPRPFARPREMSAPQPPPLQRGGHLIDLPPLTPGLVNCDSRLSEFTAAEQQVNLFGDVVSFRPPTKTPAEPDTSLINRLPFELLSEIFILSLPPVDRSWMFGETIDAYEGGCYPDIPSHLRAPVVLPAVCTYWHAIVTGTPHLWTRILVDDLCAPRQLHWAALHLKYSGHLPLVLHIHTKSRDPPSARVALLQALLPHAQRWRHFVLFANGFSFNDMRFLCAARAQSLASAKIHDACIGVHEHFWAWAMSLPSLRRVTLVLRHDIPALMNQAPGFWQDLRDLSLMRGSCQKPEVLQLLRTCPRIERLHVDCFDRDRLRSYDGDDLCVVQAMDLHTLLVVNKAHDTHTFFHHIYAPRLRHLAIDSPARHSTAESRRQLWLAVAHMLTRSGPRLKRFLYTGDEEQLMDLVKLDALRHLEELCAYKTAATSRKLLDLLIIRSDQNYLPHLKDLSLGPTYGEKDAALDKMVLSRKGTLQALQFLCLLHPIDLTVLKAASADWLAVYFGDTPYGWDFKLASS